MNERLQSTFALIISLVLFATPSESVDSDTLPIKTTEVFTTGTYPNVNCHPKAALTIQQSDCHSYRIDGIERFQTEWSQGLPNNPTQAKQVALARLQSLDPKQYQPLENAAKGLAKALKYDLDRYPAIVFDSRAVVYGVGDVEQAKTYYRQWRSQENH